MQQLLLPGAVLLPLLGGLPVFKMHKRETRRVYISALLVLEVLILLVLQWKDNTCTLFTVTDGVRLLLSADSLGCIFALLVAVLWLVVWPYGDVYMEHGHSQARFFGFYVTTLGSMMGICLAGNLVTLYMFYEMMSLLSVFMVIHTGTHKAIDAGFKYLGFSVCGAVMSLLGLMYISGFMTTDVFIPGGTLDMTRATPRAMEIALLLMLIGFGAKAGMLPLFAWLPTAHPVAPSPASAVLSGLITKMGVLAIARVVYYQFGMDFVRGSWVQQVVLCLAIFTVFMGSMLAYKEQVMKKRLAYSTVSQVSYILFGLLLLSPEGFTGAMLQLVFHAIAKNGLFMATGAVLFYMHRTRANQMRGVGKLLPVIMVGFTICSLSLIGIPPAGGFVSKWYLAQAGLGYGVLGTVGVVVLMVSALLTAGYLLPVITAAFFPGEDFDYGHLQDYIFHPSWGMRVPLLVLSVALFALGLFPEVLNWLIEPIVSALFT